MAKRLPGEVKPQAKSALNNPREKSEGVRRADYKPLRESSKGTRLTDHEGDSLKAMKRGGGSIHHTYVAEPARSRLPKLGLAERKGEHLHLTEPGKAVVDDMERRSMHGWADSRAEEKEKAHQAGVLSTRAEDKSAKAENHDRHKGDKGFSAKAAARAHTEAANAHAQAAEAHKAVGNFGDVAKHERAAEKHSGSADEYKRDDQGRFAS